MNNTLNQIIKQLDIEHTKTIFEEFTLGYHPEFDKNREKYLALFKYVKEQYKNKNILEIGYAWGGRLIPGSKVMDLYDPRTKEIDYIMDACNMQLDDNLFDLIICNSVLEHIPKFWLAAAEMQRVLKPQGLVWISVPSVWPFHPGGNNTLGDINYGGDYWRMNHQSLPVLFEHCKKLACWYIPAAPQAGDDPRNGWGVVYLGEKI
jgi:SAM-dependent methyltransferase